MPLYEYECESCGHRFERIQKYSDAPIETCPVCGKHVRKLFSSPAIQFKGTGWYVTDYARKSSDSGAGKSSGSKADSAAPASSSGDTTGTSGDTAGTKATPPAPAAATTDSKPKESS